MSSFIHKKLAPDKSVAQIIKSERQKRHWDLEKIAQATKIDINHLKRLEQGDYHKLPGDVYIQQFIKKLAVFFNFSEKKLISIYLKERQRRTNFFQPAPLALPKKNYLSKLTPKVIRTFFIGLIIIGLFSYLSWGLKNIFTPPTLKIIYPATQTITQSPSITIKGSTDLEAIVLINQQKIIIASDGSFAQEVDLNIGLNILEITAAKKHSKQNVVSISILRQPSAVSNLKPIDRGIIFQ